LPDFSCAGQALQPMSEAVPYDLGAGGDKLSVLSLSGMLHPQQVMQNPSPDTPTGSQDSGRDLRMNSKDNACTASNASSSRSTCVPGSPASNGYSYSSYTGGNDHSSHQAHEVQTPMSYRDQLRALGQQSLKVGNRQQQANPYNPQRPNKAAVAPGYVVLPNVLSSVQPPPCQQQWIPAAPQPQQMQSMVQQPLYSVMTQQTSMPARTWDYNDNTSSCNINITGASQHFADPADYAGYGLSDPQHFVAPADYGEHFAAPADAHALAAAAAHAAAQRLQPHVAAQPIATAVPAPEAEHLITEFPEPVLGGQWEDHLLGNLLLPTRPVPKQSRFKERGGRHELAAPAREPSVIVNGIEVPNVGSANHHLRQCKPCAFVHVKGCQDGTACQFCHLCDNGEKKRRKKERATQRKTGRWSPDNASE